MKELNWNVLCYNSEIDQIIDFNLFDYEEFTESAKRCLNSYREKDEFLENLRIELFYHFSSKKNWSLLLYEKKGHIFIEPWTANLYNPLRLDVTNDKTFNWKNFYDEIIFQYKTGNKFVKIDIYDQVMYRFNEFANYIWDTKEVRDIKPIDENEQSIKNSVDENVEEIKEINVKDNSKDNVSVFTIFSQKFFKRSNVSV